MTSERKREIYQSVEACREADSTDVEAEKTAAVGELMAEVGRLEQLEQH